MIRRRRRSTSPLTLTLTRTPAGLRHTLTMECPMCTTHKAKFYCAKCIKEGVRQQNYQLRSTSHKKEETTRKVNEMLSSEQRHAWEVLAEREERRIRIACMRRQIESVQTGIRKGTI